MPKLAVKAQLARVLNGAYAQHNAASRRLYHRRATKSEAHRKRRCAGDTRSASKASSRKSKRADRRVEIVRRWEQHHLASAEISNRTYPLVSRQTQNSFAPVPCSKDVLPHSSILGKPVVFRTPFLVAQSIDRDARPPPKFSGRDSPTDLHLTCQKLALEVFRHDLVHRWPTVLPLNNGAIKLGLSNALSDTPRTQINRACRFADRRTAHWCDARSQERLFQAPL